MASTLTMPTVAINTAATFRGVAPSIRGRVAVPRRTIAMTVRAQAAEEPTTEAAAEPKVAIPALPDAVPPPSNAELFSVMGPLQEAINGRAAMLGFVAAVVLERISGQSVLSQLGGRVVDGEMVERALGASDMAFAFTVVVVTLATFAPLVYANEKPGARSLGPFSAGLETTLGRVAQIGFAGLVLVEVLKGNTPLF